MPNLRPLLALLLLLSCVACRKTPVAPATPKPFVPELRFQAYSGDDPRAADISFQINVLKPSPRAEFLKLGDLIPGTTIKLTDFDAATEQLIVTDTATNQTARLSRPKPVSSPTQF